MKYISVAPSPMKYIEADISICRTDGEEVLLRLIILYVDGAK